MIPKVSTELVLLVAFGAYAFWTFPTGYFVGTAVGAGVVYVLSNNIRQAMGFLVGAIAVRMLMNLLAPARARPVAPYAEGPLPYAEGFQAKDPISVHQRLEGTKKVQPKPTEITGVLESPEILDSMQLAEIDAAQQGAPTRTVPVGMAAMGMIRTPAEGAVPPPGSVDAAPKENPYLHNGPDFAGVMTALVNKGTALFGGQPSAEVPATVTGSASGYT